MAPNQRPMDDSQVISPWGMAVRALSPEGVKPARSVPKRERSHRVSTKFEPGAKHPNAKLSDDAIRSIRKTALVRKELLRKIKEEMSTEAMARKHGVNPSTINKYVGNRLRLERVE